MYIEDDALEFRATDLSTYSACRHATLLERAVARGELERPHWDDPAKRLLAERGVEHEARYRALLEARFGVAAFRVPGAIGKTRAQWARATERTLAAMTAGHRVIYQAPLATSGWHGLADFLIRVDDAPEAPKSALGDYHYEVVDAKLAREPRASAILQLCAYSEIVAGLQGKLPEHMVIASPAGFTTSEQGADALEHRYRTADFFAYFHVIRRRFEDFAQAGELGLEYPEPVEQCDTCHWWSRCDRRRRSDDHLSLVAGMTRSHHERLVGAGVSTLSALGSLALPLPRIDGVRPEALERLQHQARLQLAARSAPHAYTLLPIEPGRGLCRLPPPSDGDVFLDLEADRYAVDGTLHYLLGWVELEGGAPVYRGLWASDRRAEQANFERFVDHIAARRERHPDLHVYHFAPFEKTALGDMSTRYASREEIVDDLLRNEVLVDLLPVVKQALRAGVESYSIKELERFYAYERRTDLRAAARARRLFELHRERGDAHEVPALVATIESYNREDCESAQHLRRWLEARRDELISAGVNVPRREPKMEQPSEAITEWAQRVAAIRARLLGALDAEPAQRNAEQHARQLLADVVDWHRREAKPGWREYFRLRALDVEELLDEPAAIAKLGPEVCKGRIAKKGSRSSRFEYTFPAQECSVRVGDKVECPFTEQSLGEVLDIDRDANIVAVKRAQPLERAPLALIVKHQEPPMKALQHALAEIAEGLAPVASAGSPAACGLARDPRYTCARALLLREAPRLAQGAPLQRDGESASDAMERVAPLLDGAVLAVQGPPGAGKTYAGGRMILELVRAGKKVGITATSHSVINHLLESLHEAAGRDPARGTPHVQSIQKKGEAPAYEHAHNTVADDAGEVADALASGHAQVAAGTAWLWCDAKLRRSLDVLVIDEAGQFSLANALAVSVAAHNLVLLGDPRQLAQPSQGTHPAGAEVSALEHLLDGAATVPRGKGLFMDRTWRLPPNIVRFTSEYFYAGRLAAHPDCQRQALRAAGAAQRFSGAGLFFEAVEHHNNVSSSLEEAERIAVIVSDLLGSGATWTDRQGEERGLTLGDVLIVAPYNLQVELIRERLGARGHEHARVGSVDKFQGQEAPVVLFSMTTSSPEDAPRGFEFLFSLNRLNVATSRARAIAIIVASPRLLEAECKTPRHMRLVNAFCGAVSAAEGASRALSSTQPACSIAQLPGGRVASAR